MHEHATALADGLNAALPAWVERAVAQRVREAGRELDAGTEAAAAAAGRLAAQELGPAIRALLAADVDDQRTTPLALFRSAVRYPTEVLAAARIPPVEREEFRATSFPDDVYDLAPASYGEIDPALHELGLAWGAAKAWTHRQRHLPGPRDGDGRS